jgi:quinoprotein dehydrogenase-associated probable ABC transporter substrate-binding protein
VIWAVVIPLHARDIRVCADPDNLPFSNMKQEGFENRIAEIVAKDLDASLIYVWQRMGRGFVREYLGKGQCDLLVGIPAAYRPVLTTTPYYRSTYVFVSRRNRTSQFSSLNSSDLRGLKIGVQVLDEQYTPPGAALARRGLQDEIVGFNTIGDGAESIVRAVAEQQVDLAIVWGPLAGYFAKKYDPNLEIKPVEPEVDSTGVPFTFAISMGVSKNNVGLRDELEKVLIQKKSEIRSVLDAYGIPQLPLISAQTNERASRRTSN